MFNLPEFLLRPRRTYAPTGNPMIDLGWETPGDVMSDTRQARTPATISYRDTLAQRQNPLMEAAQDNQINMPVAPVSEQSPLSAAAGFVGPTKPYRNKFYTGDTLPDLPVFMRDSHFQAWAKQNPEQMQEYSNMKAFGMSPAQYEAWMNEPKAPITQPYTQRFGGASGTETVTSNPDGSIRSSDFRGIPYSGEGDRMRAVAEFAKQQGQRETGIAGVPSIESIMSNQLGGLPMAPEQKRVMALGLQDKLVNPLAALERDRVQGQFGVQEAEARRRDYLSSKQSEILGYHMSQFLEQNPDATPEQIATHRDRIAMANGMAIPRAAGVAPALALAGPASRDREGTARALRTLVSDAEYNRGSMGEMLDRLAGSPDEDRPALIKAMLETRRNPVAGYAPNALRDALFQSVAYDVLKAAPDRLGSLKEGERMSPEGGLPFDIVRSGDGILNPLAAIVTRTGENIPLPWSARPSAITRGKMTQQELEQIRRRLAVAPSVLESILGGNR